MARVETVVRPQSGVYVGMLALAAFAMFLGCVLLALELNGYDWEAEAKGGPTVTLPVVKDRPAAAAPAAGTNSGPGN